MTTNELPDDPHPEGSGAGSIQVEYEASDFFVPHEDDCEDCGLPAIAFLSVISHLDGKFWNKVYCQAHLDEALTAIFGG